MNKSELFSLIAFLLVFFLIFYLEIKIFVGKFKKNKVRAWFLKKPFKIAIHTLVLIGILSFIYGYFIEPYWIEVNSIDIYTEKLKQAEFKVVQISDLHCDRKIRNEKKLIDIINSLNPDIIVFTGDSINTSAALPTFNETMMRLKAKLGKVAVRGNFEVWFWNDFDLYNSTGFKLLEKDSIEFSKNQELLRITGISPGFSDSYSMLLKEIPKGVYSIFLFHYPDLIENSEDAAVDLYLSGHTHGGQVCLPFYGALITLSKFGKKYEAGKYIVNDVILYVNRGVGMEGWLAPRVRFLARPEIAVFNIKPKK